MHLIPAGHQKEDTYQEGLLWLTGLKFKNSIAAVSKKGPLVQAMPQGGLH